MMEMIKREGCALISEAGTPAICDPGSLLVRLCHTYRSFSSSFFYLFKLFNLLNLFNLIYFI